MLRNDNRTNWSFLWTELIMWLRQRQFHRLQSINQRRRQHSSLWLHWPVWKKKDKTLQSVVMISDGRLDVPLETCSWRLLTLSAIVSCSVCRNWFPAAVSPSSLVCRHFCQRAAPVTFPEPGRYASFTNMSNFKLGFLATHGSARVTKKDKEMTRTSFSTFARTSQEDCGLFTWLKPSSSAPQTSDSHFAVKPE